MPRRRFSAISGSARVSLRDRSIVTLAALIARDQTIELPYYLDLALDNGVKPGEISEIITHLAFYSGWANAMAARQSRRTSLRRNIGADQFLRPRDRNSPSTKQRKRNGRRASDSNSGSRAESCAVHHRCAVSRSLAETGSGAA